LRRHCGDGADILIATAPGAAARSAAEKLADRGATALLSFGIAGGLDPRLPAGTLILADAVASTSAVFATDEAWRGRVAAKFRDIDSIAIGTIAGRDTPVATVFDKSALYATSEAIAVDMESHLIAEVAARRGLALLAIRAIADPASRTLPRAALDAAGADGSVRIGALILGLARRPGDVVSLWGLARDYRAAMATLRRAATEAAAALRVG